MDRPYITVQEVAVAKLPMAVLGVVLFAVACDSRVPSAPTTVTQPTGAPSAGAPAASSPLGYGPTPIAGTPLSAGTQVEGTIDERDPACFYNWDASGRCRQFDLTAPADGTLFATLTWPGLSRGLLYDPDVFLVAPSGMWVHSEGWPVKNANLPAASGLVYRIVVMSYGPAPQDFVLRVDLQP